ncbi:hypothetical protein TRFO_12989 [Tritrichomonas foetus]|uniref:Uncharacterized protein n=1 Tax=Tritrichomonas foetus TaxID=1144522 RepID=A0A1J4KZP5_9EUKA|nr:hypothetical protein TRFO_12989 [Tritrichomonas foetus]|eukprot:OHT16729.1 hypothetical protein TRFO_12989 [Tritrichomonas foetus]
MQTLNFSASADELDLQGKLSKRITPKTARVKYQNHSTLQLLKSDINKYSLEIDALSEINTESRNECNTLVENIEAISKGLNHNIDMITETNRKLERSNAKLNYSIDRQAYLIKKISSLYRDLSLSGIDIKKFDNVEFDLIVKLTGKEYKVKNFDINESIRKMINQTPYFKGVKGHEDFLRRCSSLVKDSNEVIFRLPKFTGNGYQEKINKLKAYNEEMHAKIAEEINELSYEKDRIVNQASTSNSKIPNSKKYLDILLSTNDDLYAF